MKRIKRIRGFRLRAKNFLSQRPGRRTAYSLAVLVALSACGIAPGLAPLQTNNLKESLRVESVSVVLKDEQQAIAAIESAFGQDEVRNYPRESVGLTKSKIVSDFSSALRRELIAASQKGQRPVDVRVQFRNMTLMGDLGEKVGNFAMSDLTIAQAFLFVRDRESGKMLIEKEFVSVCMCDRQRWMNETPNVVQSYEYLLKAFPAEIKRRLLK